MTKGWHLNNRKNVMVALSRDREHCVSRFGTGQGNQEKPKQVQNNLLILRCLEVLSGDVDMAVKYTGLEFRGAV